MKNIFSIFKKKKHSEFHKRLMEDWGKEDVFGHWTKELSKDGEFKYYKSYWLISYGGEPNIDLLPPYDESNFNS